jgi:hypothetical protein
MNNQILRKVQNAISRLKIHNYPSPHVESDENYIYVKYQNGMNTIGDLRISYEKVGKNLN